MFLFWMKGSSRVNGKAAGNCLDQPLYSSLKEACVTASPTTRYSFSEVIWVRHLALCEHQKVTCMRPSLDVTISRIFC